MAQGVPFAVGSRLAHPMMYQQPILFNVFLVLLFILAFVAILYWLFKSSRPTPSNPLEIAKIRYAKGELTREEYLHLKKELET
ncbi:Uncharacterised protein [uncultured archaeon]|nr:Uncharacterised protein [uncultured archaeon]